MKCIYYYVVDKRTSILKCINETSFIYSTKNEIYEIYKLTQNIDVNQQMLSSHRVYNFI